MQPYTNKDTFAAHRSYVSRRRGWRKFRTTPVVSGLALRLEFRSKNLFDIKFENFCFIRVGKNKNLKAPAQV